MGAYLFQVLIGLDQLLNTMLGGWADETVSSRAWRLHQAYRAWAVARRAIDAVFWYWQPNHCQASFESERLRLQIPPELRQ
jgi:hypothetical protein